MDEQQKRIHEDLAGLFQGELEFNPLTRSMYSTDSSLYQLTPLGIAYPRGQEDVVTLAKYATEHDLPLIARGAGTGLAGSALGLGMIVDFSRHMRAIEVCDEESVVVQPGVVRDQLNAVLRQYGRYFAPDPSNSAVTTVGGMLAVDAAGSHAIRVGSTRDHVQEIQVTLAGGESFTAGNESLHDLGDESPLASSPWETTGDSGFFSVPARPVVNKQLILARLAKLLRDNQQLIQQRQPAAIRNCCGYFLRGVLSDTHLNLARMLVGTEGTLALFTSARLHTSPIPAHRGVALLLFGRIEDAVQVVQAIARKQPSACDLLDRRLLSLAREADPRFAELIPPTAEAALIVEQVGFNDREVKERMRMAVVAARDQVSRLVVAQEAYAPDGVEFLWSLPAKVVPLLTRLKGSSRPQPFVEDLAVPPASLNEFLIRAQRVFQKHRVTASLYAHAASGQLHLRPFLPAPTPPDAPQLEAIARDLYQVVFLVGGSISGEHGDGLARTSFIRSQYGSLYKVFQQIKEIFDPQNLLNPGKIISDDAHLTIQNLRPASPAADSVTSLQLAWNPQELSQQVQRCNGCGVCKTQSPEQRMCPFFRLEPMEQTSPRSKANVLRDYLAGKLSEEDFTSEHLQELTSTCFNCKQCQLECPSNVNIPQMVIEARAQYAAANGISRTDWILSRAHSFGALGSSMSMLTNWMLNNPTARWFLEKFFGIARLRKLPLFARRSFLLSAPREVFAPPQKFSRRQPTVVYFVDHYANYHDPELAKAFLAVMSHNGYRVHVPRNQQFSGMAMISAGDLEAAREVAEHNVRELAELAREGYPIVCTEPAAVLAFQQEYPRLLDHPDVQQVASQAIEAGTFLEKLHRAGKLKTDFQPLKLNAGAHTPCHLKALQVGTPFRALLELIPGLNVQRIERGCSGMAGAYGLTAANYNDSLRMGWGLMSRMQAGDLNIGVTECSSCKIQMEQGATAPTLHPLKLLALAYGLMPEIREKLTPTRRKLIVS